MKPPPRWYPKTLDLQFAADPFDVRMHRNSPTRDHTPLGLLIEILHWCRANEVPPALMPVLKSVEACLRREAPDALADLEKMQ